MFAEPKATDADPAHGPSTANDVLLTLAATVEQLARQVDSMWAQDPTDGSTALRLVEASHALHRAAIALQEDLVICRLFAGN